VTGSAESSGAQEAGRYLAELLKREPYRRRWNRPDWVQRARKSELHHTAIARVLAKHLQDNPRTGKEDDDERIMPSQLVTLVSNALNGVRLSAESLHRFITAFEITSEHAGRLWRLHDDSRTIHLLPGPSAVPLETLAALPARRHTTHFVHDHHYLGPKGLPNRHETSQVIEATVDGLDRYVYAFDTSFLTVEVLTGGTLGAPYSAPNGIHAVDIIFDHPLQLGQRHALEYETTFRYEAKPPPELRRVVSVRVEYAEVKVTFHPAKLPARIWEADWEGVASEPVKGPTVIPDDYRTVRRFVRDVENTGFGFVWEW
jgi:hypothetical protein